MRMNGEETERLQSLAAHYNLTAAGIIRMLLKREEDSIARMAHSHVRERSSGEHAVAPPVAVAVAANDDSG